MINAELQLGWRTMAQVNDLIFCESRGMIHSQRCVFLELSVVTQFFREAGHLLMQARRG